VAGSARCVVGVRTPPRRPLQRGRSGLPDRFRWACSAPILGPAGAGVVAIKDPSVVYYDRMWHIYATMRSARPAQMHYIGLRDWARPGDAVRRDIALSDTYHCAPQILYMRPQRKWYLMYQWSDGAKTPPVFGPAFSTLDHPGRPQTLTEPAHMLPAKPDHVSGWLDFWAICDESRVHLFFTSLDGCRLGVVLRVTAQSADDVVEPLVELVEIGGEPIEEPHLPGRLIGRTAQLEGSEQGIRFGRERRVRPWNGHDDREHTLVVVG